MNAKPPMLVMLAIAGALSGQRLEFEAASVRASGPPQPGQRMVPGRGGPGSADPERITYERMPMLRLLTDAFRLGPDQINGPDWAMTNDPRAKDLFDITAKVPVGATKEQIAEMLQNLLKDRFLLMTHRVTKEFSGYALVVAKGGAKLQESSGPVARSERAGVGEGGAINNDLAKDGFPLLFPYANSGAWGNLSEARWRFRDYPVSELALQLEILTGFHVMDRTGLPGEYDFTLKFDTPSAQMWPQLPHMPGQLVYLSGTPAAVQLDGFPILNAALEKQLGLKLENAKIPLEVLVIDHIERTPSDN